MNQEKNKKDLRGLLIIVFVGLFLIAGFWFLKNNLENFFFLAVLGSTETENTRNDYQALKPFRNWEVETPEITAKSALLVEIQPNGTEKFLFEQESNQSLGIASLTKLMTAAIALENYDFDQIVIISDIEIEGSQNPGNFKIGETFYFKDLLYALLLESNNEAALAFAQTMGEQKFINLMNQKARELDLEKTYFIDATGLSYENFNTASARDLASLVFYLKNKALLWQISQTKDFELHNSSGVFHHKIENKNELLENPKIPWSGKIIGGKTGWTPQAGDCLILVLDSPQKENLLVGVILGSADRFGEMEKMINWALEAYQW